MKTLYFLNRGDLITENQFVPIQPKKSEWVQERDPNRLRREYQFDDYEQIAFFVKTLMSYANRVLHYPVIKIMQDKSVEVVTYTSDLFDVTDQDVRMTKMSDQIYQDATYVAPEELERAEQGDNNVDNDERLAEGYRFDWTTDW
jgi:pterin-4a-carbinolamine dehydratase